MIGARMFLPSDQVGLIIDKGFDFPISFEKELKEFGEEMIYWRRRDGKTTRTLNVYSGKKVG